ncbi:MAG: hypothetical protein AABZ06_07015 [Bdellovibrionota bacterium]
MSTCNRQRTGLIFCSVDCFDAHVPVLNHRDAGAFERRSPTQVEFEAAKKSAEAKEVSYKSASVQVKPAPAPAKPVALVVPAVEEEVLVVVSKMKDYIRQRAGMNTSDAVSYAISRYIRRWCDRAIQNAQAAGRQTVMDRDVR